MPNLYTVFDNRTPIITGNMRQLEQWCEAQGYDWGHAPWEIRDGNRRLEVRLVQTAPDGKPGVQFYSPEEFVFVQLGGW